MKFDWGELRNVTIGLLPMLGYGRTTMNLNDIIVKHMPNTMLISRNSELVHLSIWCSIGTESFQKIRQLVG